MKATLTWNAPTQNTDGSAINGPVTYNVYQGASASTLAKVQSGLTVPTAVVTTGLAPGTTEFFAVSAVVNGVESADSIVVSVAIPFPTPNAPTGLAVTLS